MPYTKIAEIQARIFQATEAIEKARKRLAGGSAERRKVQAEIDGLLNTLARLKAERTRLMMRQVEREDHNST